MENSERRLSFMEAQVAGLSAAITRLDSNSRILSDVEKAITEMKGDLKGVCSQIIRVQDDQESLEVETAKAHEASRREISGIVNTLVPAIESMTENFKMAVKTLSDTYEIKIRQDIEPRLKLLETQNWKLTGAVSLGAFVVGCSIPVLISIFR